MFSTRSRPHAWAAVVFPFALLVSCEAIAQAPSAASRAYLGLGLGMGDVSLESSTGSVRGTSVATQSGKDNALAPKIYAGYRQGIWGVELGYHDFGGKHQQILSTPAGTASGTMKLSAFYAAATATAQPAPNVSLFAKLGLARSYLVVNSLCVGTTCTASRGTASHHWTWAPGVGAEYALNNAWGLRLDYDDYGKVSAGDVLSTGDSGAIRARAWTVSATKNF